MSIIFDKMQHASTGIYAAMGEMMLRLAAPGYERLLQSPELKATFGGGESNVMVSCANMGLPARFISAFPDNYLGQQAIRTLKGFDVDVSPVVIKNNSRMGIYFLEKGANQRPSTVIYDRADSAFSTMGPDDINWEFALKDVSWFHITGITPALSKSALELSIKGMEEAKKHGAVTSIDLNFRAKLWNYGKKASEVMPHLAALTDVIIANEEDVQKSLGIGTDLDPTHGEINRDRYAQLAAQVFKDYKDLSLLAITLRESVSASHNRWSACLSNGDETVFSRTYDITNIVDRVGGGDSFAAGLIYGLSRLETGEEAVNFAVAASCLNHSIEGDINLSSLSDIMNLYQGDSSGRISR